MPLKNTFSQHSFLKTTKYNRDGIRIFQRDVFSKKTGSKNEEEGKDSSRIDRAL